MRVAVAGCGAFGRNHLRVYRELELAGQPVALVAAVEPDAARAADAARVQYERNLAASFVLNLYALRNDERQIKLFQETIIPRGRQMIELAQTSYSTGKLPFADLVEAERELLNARLVTAQLLVERDKALLAIESWSAVDAEAMRPTTNK